MAVGPTLNVSSLRTYSGNEGNISLRTNPVYAITRPQLRYCLVYLVSHPPRDDPRFAAPSPRLRRRPTKSWPVRELKTLRIQRALFLAINDAPDSFNDIRGLVIPVLFAPGESRLHELLEQIAIQDDRASALYAVSGDAEVSTLGSATYPPRPILLKLPHLPYALRSHMVIRHGRITPGGVPKRGREMVERPRRRALHHRPGL